jgi:hypothetical protein
LFGIDADTGYLDRLLAYRFLRVTVQQIQCEGAKSGSRSSKAARYWEEGGKRWIGSAKREDEYSLVSDTFTQKESATAQSLPYTLSGKR